jgi:hypothetical protein
MGTARSNYYLRALAGMWRRVWPLMRQVLGWMFILLGILGLVLPVLQGVLFLVIGVALVGRRNWLIRRSTVAVKRYLRRWARVEHRLIGALGRMALKAQRQCSRQSRQLHRRFAARRARLRPNTAAGEPDEARHDRASERV